jgi:hypothetical protein
MYIGTKKIVKQYQRASKHGLTHTYKRIVTIVVFTCDSCGITFERSQGQVDPRRCNNDYYHVCPNCDTKQFAQSKGVERRRMWNTPVNSDIRI